MTQITSAILTQINPTQRNELTRGASDPAQAPTVTAVQAPDRIEISSAGREMQAEDDRPGPKDQKNLSPEDQKKVQELQSRDREVRAHEQAHLSALGGEGGSAQFKYEQGPDGKRYAVEGEVPVSIGEVSGNPRATIEKARRVARAAVAPAQPSGADQRARAKALQVEAEARAKLKETEEAEKSGKSVSTATGGIDAGAEAATSLIDSASSATKSEQSGPCGVCIPENQGKSAPQISVVVEGFQRSAEAPDRA